MCGESVIGRQSPLRGMFTTQIVGDCTFGSIDGVVVSEADASAIHLKLSDPLLVMAAPPDAMHA